MAKDEAMDGGAPVAEPTAPAADNEPTAPAAHDTTDSEAATDPGACVRRIWEACAGMRWRLVVAALSAVLYVLASLAAPVYSARVVDLLWTNIQAAHAAGERYVVTLANGGSQILVFFSIWTAAWVFYTVQVRVMASFAERLNLQLRHDISAKLARLPLSYHDAHQPGDTISRATNDLDKLSEVLQRGLLQMLISTGMLVGAVVAMLVLNVRLGLVFVACVAASLLVTKAVSASTLRAAEARQAATGALTSYVEEAYSGRVVIRAFGQERSSVDALRAEADELARTSARADYLTNAVGPAVRFLVRLSLVAIAVLAGGMLLAGQLTVGVFQAFFQYVNTASEPLAQMSMTTNMLQAAIAAAERVFFLLDEAEVEADPAHPLAVAEPVRGRVAFEHVRFGYAPGRPLMRDVSFVASPGQKVAVVGATGAGKTTLINLLMRFYEVDGGRITLDGVDTRSMRAADLRRQFGMVLQDAWLFEGTVADNIAYGRPDATREQVIAAARAARVDHYVRTLPDGYDTMLENDAESISQGQRQLLTIARAMLTDPAILILDEATSSVDTRTEQAIVRAMETLMAGRTSFVIAHRLSTIVDADLILVMEAGTIVEQGTHDELVAAGGAYAELYRSQFA